MKLAVEPINNPLLNLPDTSAAGFFGELISILVTLLLIAGVVIFFFMLMISAINWITSGGDKAKATAAREKMINAFIGLLILFSIFAIIQIVGALFDLNLLNLDLSVLQIGSGSGGGCPPQPCSGGWQWCSDICSCQPQCPI